MLPNPACTRRGYRRSKSAVDMRLKLVLWQRIFHETRRAGEANRSGRSLPQKAREAPSPNGRGNSEVRGIALSQHTDEAAPLGKKLPFGNPVS
jgi:hypothetical protein